MLNLTKELAAARKAAKKKTAKKAAKKPAAKKKTPKTNDHVAKLQEHLDAGRFLEGMVHLEALAKDKSVRNEDLKGMASKFLGVKVGGGNRKKLIEDMKSQFIVRQRETMKEASAKATSKTWSTDDGSHKKSGGATEAIDAILAQPHTPRHSTEGNVSHDRPAAKADQKIGGWTLHTDEATGGVAVIMGKTVHVFTGRMAKASAVAFAKNHEAAKASKRAKKAEDEALTPEEAPLADGIMSAIQAAKSNRPKFEMITTTTPKEEKPKIKAANAAKMDEFRDKYFNPIQAAISKAEKAGVGANFWKTLAKDKRFYAVGVKSGKDAKKAIAMALRDIERGVGRAKVGAEEINGIF